VDQLTVNPAIRSPGHDGLPVMTEPIPHFEPSEQVRCLDHETMSWASQTAGGIRQRRLFRVERDIPGRPGAIQRGTSVARAAGPGFRHGRTESAAVVRPGQRGWPGVAVCQCPEVVWTALTDADKTGAFLYGLAAPSTWACSTHSDGERPLRRRRYSE
jgi:hypothetical protein